MRFIGSGFRLELRGICLRYLNDQERSRLLEACRRSPNKHLYPLVITALYTGLRRGSLLSLTPAMVDCERGTISLNKMKNGSQHISSTWQM